MSAARPDLAACAVLALALTCVVGKPSGPAKAPAAGDAASPPRPFAAAATRPARFVPLPGAVTNRAWLLRGAYEDGFSLRPSGWWARAADGGWIASLRVLSSGGAAARTEAGASAAWPPPFAGKASLAPAANWPRLVRVDGGQGAAAPASLFWHAATPSNTLVLTWQDALRGRSREDLVSFQMELSGGGCAYRFADAGAPADFTVAATPFDRDGDGLENGVDPAPDAHGTGAAWRAAVCAGMVNTDAYYVVEAVAARGPAPIRFAADRESALGSPAVVARAGETNRVPLLIGVEYAVVSDSPFSLAVPTDGYARVVTNGAASYTVKWPLEFERFEDKNGCTVVPWPVDPGGTWDWGGAAEQPLRARRRSADAGAGGCACMRAAGNRVTYDCREDSDCGGLCVLAGTYRFEGAAFAVTGGVCRCGVPSAEDPPDWEEGEDDPPSGVSADVRFSDAVAFFEDAYANAPGDVVARRATRTTLEIEASASGDGAILHVEAENIARLTRVGGDALSFPFTRMLADGESVSYSVIYEPETPSGAEGDIAVRARIKPPGGATASAQARATAVKVEITPDVIISDAVRNRHVFGVGERILYTLTPPCPSVSASVSGAEEFAEGGYRGFICPIVADTAPSVVFTSGNASYAPLLSVIEPTGVECRAATCAPFIPNIGNGMNLDLYVMPTNVSFGGLSMQEVPCLRGTHTGYFAQYEYQDRWSHTARWGAGKWLNIQPDNFWGQDRSFLMVWIAPWSVGQMVWQIPIGWKSQSDTERQTPVKNLPIEYQAVWTMDANGTLTKTKHGHTLTRTSDGDVLLDGVKVQ